MKIATRFGRIFFVMHAAGLLTLSAIAPVPAAASYIQTNLVSDLPGLAAFTDPNLVNPWGMSSSPTGPWWVSANGMGVTTLYNGNTGQPFPQPTPLVVTIPGAGTPTGQVFNSNTVGGAFNGDLFLFVSQDGTVSGWKPTLGTNAETLVTASPTNVYTGAAFATTGGNSYLYAANFSAGAIDVVKGTAGAPDLAGNFTDPNLPAGYAPFNIQNLGGQLYVAYAQSDPNNPGEEVTGAGLGIVDVFDTAGNLIRRIAAGGTLNAPWGLALAPSDFGEFSNDLLVGNFGDGTINAFDPATDTFLGQLADGTNNPIAIDGLWGIGFGNDGNAGPHNTLFFAAGIEDERHGLFGSLTATTPGAVPEPGTLGLMAGLVPLLLWNVRRRANGAPPPESTRPASS